MRDFRTLIKMQKLYVDEQRRVLAARQTEADELTAAITTLHANLEIEKARAHEQIEGAVLIGAFIKKELKRERIFQNALRVKEREVETERAKLSVLFEELKRYEIAQENRDVKERTEAQKRENAVYDEQAGQRHHKQQGEN